MYSGAWHCPAELSLLHLSLMVTRLSDAELVAKLNAVSIASLEGPDVG